MRVGLHDADKTAFPNLALMKISAWHKAQGDTVEWYNALFGADKVYSSKIFTFSPDDDYLPEDTIKGGTGYDVSSKLPLEIDQQAPDYSIYRNCDFSIQRFSVGCIRDCSFCIVKEKDGPIRAVNPLATNPNGHHVEVFDNNYFGNPMWRDSSEWIRENNQPVSLHGVDVRLIDEEQAEALNAMRHRKQIHIAWDNPEEDILSHVTRAVKWIKPYRLMCYVLIGFNSSPDQDYYRVMELRNLKIDPFVMPFNKADNYQKRFARWVNHKAIFKTVDWESYK